MNRQGTQKLRIIVGGLVGQYPLGGVAWDYFHYVLALHELGHDVYYYEDTWVWPHDPILGYPTDKPEYTISFIREFFQQYAPELNDKWCYVLLHDAHHGMSREAFDEVARSADLFINISGACFTPDQLNPRALKVFMDTDPGYNQIMLHEKFAWSENVERWCDLVRSHDRHLTYAENIYAPDCLLPRMDFDWRPTRCLVTLPHWQTIRDHPPVAGAPYTTVMTWSYYAGDLIFNGVKYGTKVEEYARFHDLPRRVDLPLTLAVAGYKAPRDQIKADGWTLVDGKQVSLTPPLYQQFIADSAGEWSIAKNFYVAMRTGWFSCRTACYLAAGRPAVVQDTAWSRFIPAGEGLIAFETMEQAIAGLNEIAAHPRRHQLAAYDIARAYLAPDKVLPPMIEAIFAEPRQNPTTPGPVPPSINQLP